MLTTTKRTVTRALAAAALFHLIVTLSVFSAGRFSVAPEKFDRDGIGEFAKDGRVHKARVDSLVSGLKQGQFRSWIDSNDPLHVKIYSLSVLPLEPVLGNNILAVEPINLIFYLAILALTFAIGRIIAGDRAAWLAAVVVALWPTLVLHTTQFLRDPPVIAGALALFIILVIILKRDLNWRAAAAVVVAGAVAIFFVWHLRPEIWLVMTAIVFVALLLLLIKFAVTRKLIAINLLTLATLLVLAIAMPRPAVGIVSMPLSSPAAGPAGESSSISRRIALARAKFIFESRNVSGSLIDDDVELNSWSDVIRYIPRALEIGYLAPFPSMWFERGNKVGLSGRIVSGLETLLTYAFEILAGIFLWRNRKQPAVWLLVLTTLIGVLALGLVVANLGTLYRMRYPFWILLVIMAAGALVDLYRSKFGSTHQGLDEGPSTTAASTASV